MYVSDGSFTPVDPGVLAKILANEPGISVCNDETATQQGHASNENEDCPDEADRGKRSLWSNAATLSLIQHYSDLKHKFDSPRFKKNAVWRELTEKLGREGFVFSSEQVEGRWKTLVAAYRRVKDHNNKSGNDRKEMTFYNELKVILDKNPAVVPSCTISSATGLEQGISGKGSNVMKCPRKGKKTVFLIISLLFG